MINAIIFSKDRASQLHLLLESIYYNFYKNLDEITIIHTASSPEFAQGYEFLRNEHIIPRLKINWLQEQNLEKDTISTVASYAKGDKYFTLFFTDDSVMYKSVQDSKFVIESSLHKGSDIGCFTLRMGLNTTEQMYWQPGNTISPRYIQVGNIIKWRHVDYPAEHAYGYPLSLDGHIYRSADILNLVQSVAGFKTVNNLEASLSRYKYEISPCMASFEQSLLVTVPINRVQNQYQNVSGLFYGISAKELNRRYLAGEIIDYQAINFGAINGTHQELEYKFRSK